MAEVGQTEKNPVRANVFRISSESGPYSRRSALRICANSGQSHSIVIGSLERREQHATDVVARVPELTTIADIKLNERHPLRRCKKTGYVRSYRTFPGCRREAVGRTFLARRLV
jgi:hypothetical protein